MKAEKKLSFHAHVSFLFHHIVFYKVSRDLH